MFRKAGRVEEFPLADLCESHCAHCQPEEDDDEAEDGADDAECARVELEAELKGGTGEDAQGKGKAPPA